MFRLAKALACTGGALLLAGLGPVAGTASAGTQAPSTGTATARLGEFHQIRNVSTGLCLQALSGSFGSLIFQANCDSGVALQGWQTLPPPGRDLLRFESPSGLCMFVGDNPVNGSAVLLDECRVQGKDSVSNAEWTASAGLPNAVSLRTQVNGRDHNLCMSGTGIALAVRTCNNNSFDQRWLVGF
ncbi:ricin-type beta-trefoil lectin domain protein [Amycolatopsis sp. NPDC051102]|uniref:ricin-type beta-trefoil lectin domain protein n=1 Tax=Amycolatopsis sp. NPDC051102 TaxID=3155163 RepID=UPI00341A3755